MLTTAIGAQDCNIALRAASPRPPRPYPTEVGTPTTGARTSPANTVGSAPSRPANARYTSGWLRSSRSAARSNRWSPATPTSYAVTTRIPNSRRVARASSASGTSLVPALTTATTPGRYSPPNGPESRTRRSLARNRRGSPRELSSRRARSWASVGREINAPCPCAAHARTIPTRCATDFPSPRMISGTPTRRNRSRSRRAYPPTDSSRPALPRWASRRASAISKPCDRPLHSKLLGHEAIRPSDRARIFHGPSEVWGPRYRASAPETRRSAPEVGVS